MYPESFRVFVQKYRIKILKFQKFQFREIAIKVDMRTVISCVFKISKFNNFDPVKSIWLQLGLSLIIKNNTKL